MMKSWFISGLLLMTFLVVSMSLDTLALLTNTWSHLHILGIAFLFVFITMWVVAFTTIIDEVRFSSRSFVRRGLWYMSFVSFITPCYIKYMLCKAGSTPEIVMWGIYSITLLFMYCIVFYHIIDEVGG